jgi:hypothetical protein
MLDCKKLSPIILQYLISPDFDGVEIHSFDTRYLLPPLLLAKLLLCTQKR